MIYGYTRISKNDGQLDGQKSLIARFVVDKQWVIHQWFEVEMSSRKSIEKRKITDLLEMLKAGDVVIASEISRIGRSIKEVFEIIEKIIQKKQCRLILIKQGLDLDPNNQHDVTNKVLLTIFSMMAELERDFISERTKEGLRARKEKGIKLGKPKGVIQKSMYDDDKERIKELYQLGVPIKIIVSNHLKYGKYYSLKNFIKKKIL